MQRVAGSVIQFPRRPKGPVYPRVPTMRIGGKVYRLSNIPGHMYLLDGGGPEDDRSEEEGARVIRGKPGFNYLYAVEPSTGEMVMWQAREGSEKMRRSYRRTPAGFLQKLEAAGALNEVTRSELATLDRAMARKAQKLLKEMQDAYLGDHPMYAAAQGMVREMAMKVVVPEFRRRMKEVARGALPFGFQEVEGGFPRERQVASYLMGEVTRRMFTEDQIEAYLVAKGVPVDQLDMQDIYFIRHEILDELGRKLLPSVR